MLSEVPMNRIVGDEGAMGVVPVDCKKGGMGNRNLYHFTLTAIIILDIIYPLVLVGILVGSLDTSNWTILNKTLPLNPFAAPPKVPVQVLQKTDQPLVPCCSLPVSLVNLLVSFILFAIFITVTSVEEPGTMAHYWDANFCNKYVRNQHHILFTINVYFDILTLFFQWNETALLVQRPNIQISGHVRFFFKFQFK
jgi:hypothetical protein